MIEKLPFKQMKNCWVHVANGGIGINNLEKMLFCYIIKLEKLRNDLIDLDTETKSLKSYFAEWSLLWLDAIISLRMSEIKM